MSQQNQAMPRLEFSFSSVLGSLPLEPWVCSYAASARRASAMCHCVLDASKSKWDQPRVHDGSPQLAEPSFVLKTVLLVSFSQMVKIMTTSTEQLFPRVLSVNAGSDCITISSAASYFKNNADEGKASEAK